MKKLSTKTYPSFTAKLIPLLPPRRAHRTLKFIENSIKPVKI